MNSQATHTEAPRGHPPLWQVACAIVWLLVFAACFYQFDLPNSSPRVNRTEVWRQLPSLLVNMVDPPPPAADDIEARQLWKNAGWRFWPQRFGMYGVSLAILAGAWGWGSLALRLMRVPLPAWSLERIFFAGACGLAVVSLLTLGCGLAGLLSQGLLASCLTLGPILELALSLSVKRSPIASSVDSRSLSTRLKQLWPLWLLVPFLMVYVGGAFLPETDFDVKEYHFGGPKEWYLAGRISFLPHNVYTSFPFLTEMLTLLGMVLYGDWYWGAIAGKGVLMSFAPLTALGLFIAGRKWFSPRAGIWAALIHLSTPWIYRISIIAYAEGGLTCYLFATLLAVLFYIETLSSQFSLSGMGATGSASAGSPSAGTPSTGTASGTLIHDQDQARATAELPWAILAGFLGGSAMACKYPGAVSVVIPLGLALLLSTYRSHRHGPWRLVIQTGLVFSLGVALAIGPWLLKNLVETGNPVYPLLYGVFGGTDWSPELNAKWKHGHSPDHHQLGDLAVKLMDVTLKSDWLSPLLFGLAPLALLTSRRRLVSELWLYVAFLFATWWLLTHRIDRFWVPLIPVVALLAGVGATWTNQRVWRIFVTGFAICAATFNFAFMTTSLCGYNAYLLDLPRAAEQTARITAPEVLTLNSTLPAGSKVLCVGEAELFDARFPYVYNTVFDVSIFEQWFGVTDSSGGSANRPLKPAAEIRQLLKEQGITHVFVNWQEILRYRLTYGYTDFVTPRRFQQLQAAGILDAEWQMPGGQLFDTMDVRSQQEVRNWGPELIREETGQRIFRTYEIFPVLP
ncbi:MAG: hypothetical protein JWN70_2809 [Planctomycetaceae bacterium]|nr:hypothetical protein [Planctomycetaceae bacterium]